MFANFRHAIGRQLRVDRRARSKRDLDSTLGVRVQLSATKIDYVSRRERNLQTLDVLSRWAILESARAGCISRDVAAEKATAFSGIGRIHQAFSLNRALQIAEDH